MTIPSTTPAPEARYSAWFLATTADFVTCLITANINAATLIRVPGWIPPAAVLTSPVRYIVCDRS